ncbi:MAG: hypothetical protein XXXJIFNMEKO3_01947 [Candidatus Erwinia impunctatus]|nr:hypothetical protein XXXJIFNMEKO_01947 [Culicoides impunctatus]
MFPEPYSLTLQILSSVSLVENGIRCFLPDISVTIRFGIFLSDAMCFCTDNVHGDQQRTQSVMIPDIVLR